MRRAAASVALASLKCNLTFAVYPVAADISMWDVEPRSVDKRWAEVGHRARRCDGEAVDWAFGETGAGKSGATPLHPAGDGGSVEWMIEAEDAQTLPHRIPVAV